MKSTYLRTAEGSAVRDESATADASRERLNLGPRNTSLSELGRSGTITFAMPQTMLDVFVEAAASGTKGIIMKGEMFPDSGPEAS